MKIDTFKVPRRTRCTKAQVWKEHQEFHILNKDIRKFKIINRWDILLNDVVDK